MTSDLIDQQKFKFVDNIRIGRFDIQVKAVEIETNQPVILSFWYKNKNDLTKEQYNSWTSMLKNFISGHRSLNNPVILEIKDYEIKINSQGQTFCCLITSYPANGCIFPLIKQYLDTNGSNHDKMNPTIRSKIIFGVAVAMNCLHENNFISNNLSLSNIYLDENFEPKIINCNLSYIFDTIPHTLPSYDLLYLAPEVFNGTYRFIKEVDVYAFAMVIYRMFSKEIEKQPFRFFSKTSRGWRPEKPELMPDCYWELVCNCWKDSHEDRPSFDEIIEMLEDEKFALEEFGMKTDIDELREYQNRVYQGPKSNDKDS